jgi:hypothetical protein
MGTVSIERSTIKSVPYTWSTATIPWDTATKSWDNFNDEIFAYTLTIGEDIRLVPYDTYADITDTDTYDTYTSDYGSLHGEETFTASVTKLLKSSFKIADSKQAKSVSKKLTDTVQLADEFTRTITIIKYVLEAIATQDTQPAKSIAKLASDAINLVDKRGAFSISHAEADKFTLTDKRIATVAKALEDNATILDAITNGFMTYQTDAINLVDKRGAFIGAKRVYEVLDVCETYWDNIFYILKVLENVDILETPLKAVDKPFSEKAIAITDAIVVAIAKNVLQTLAIGEELEKELVRIFSDTIGIIDGYTDVIAYYRTLAESVKLADKRAGFTSAKSLQDSFSVAELAKKIGAKPFTEAFRVADSCNKSTRIDKSELVGISDKLLRGIITRQFENISVLEELLRSVVFARSVREYVAIADKKGGYQFSKDAKENARITDGLAKSISLASKEDLSLIDGFLREFIAKRAFSENVKLSEFLVKKYRLRTQEAMEAYDCMLRACNGILSNVEIKEGELSDDDFETVVNSVAGFGVFTDFKVGEYEYKEALVRILVETAAQGLQASVANAVMHVDIPDTDDRGSLRITDTTQATKVYFNKFYYHAPEVNVSLRGATVGDSIIYPNITNTEGEDEYGRYFEVEILNSFGERVQGYITWASKGY